LAETYAARTRKHSITFSEKASGHQIGEGGHFQDTLEVTRDADVVLRVVVNSSYSTSSDDFFDYSTGDYVSIWSCEENGPQDLYDTLTAQVMFDYALDEVYPVGCKRALGSDSTVGAILNALGTRVLPAMKSYLRNPKNASEGFLAALRYHSPDFVLPSHVKDESAVGEYVI
jgi:hypothetical protein